MQVSVPRPVGFPGAFSAARPRRWQPPLRGPLLDQARLTIADIAESLAVPGATEDADVTLSMGHAGIALFEAYAAAAGFGRQLEDRARRRLERSIEALESAPSGPLLFQGFVGVAWAAAHLRTLLPDALDEDANDEIDAVLLDALRALPAGSPWPFHYDLVSGLVGLGVYGWERLPSASAVRLLEEIVDLLAATAEHGRDGIAWRTPPEHVPPKARAAMAEGYYNLGVAHGMPGVIALLGGLCAIDIRAAVAGPLLDGAVRWMRSRREPGDVPSLHPAWITVGVGPTSARMAWCYGDPGVAGAMLVAAVAIRDRDLEADALAVARRAAGCVPERSRVVDATLCHGSAGLLHIYNRFLQASGDEVFAEAVRRWTRVTLDLRSPGQGLAGFRAWDQLTEDTEGWKTHPGFLMGVAGVGLALLAAVTSIEPDWDRLLLLSAPPRGVLG